MAVTPVRSVVSGTGANLLVCSPGSGLPVLTAAHQGRYLVILQTESAKVLAGHDGVLIKHVLRTSITVPCH
jgi:hypothetical protein